MEFAIIYISTCIMICYLAKISQSSNDNENQQIREELEAWKNESQINENYLEAIGDLIPDEEKTTKVQDVDKEPSILKRIWWNVENALYK